ncbi:NUDIX hydrolase [Candidatus Dependentiae bacterium]
MQNLVHLEKPGNFLPKMEVVSCYCQFGDTFLFLKRNECKPYGNTWGLPAGKLDSGETKEQAVLRELFEETGIVLCEKDICLFKTVFVKYPDIDFLFHIFKATFLKKPEKIKISKAEHSQARWVTVNEALQLDLIPGADECIKLASGYCK